MNKTELIRKIYTIVLGVFIAAVGIALICVAADIYYSGEGPGLIYSREIVGERLKRLAIPLLCLVAMIIAGVLFPVAELKSKRTSEETLRKLKRRMPADGDGEEFAAAKNAYKKKSVIKLVVWCVALAIALAMAIVIIVYLARTRHFQEGSLTQHILGLVRVALPCTVAALLALTAASVVGGFCAKEQVKQLKTMIKCGSREIALPAELKIYDGAEKIASHSITLWVARGIVFAVAVAFIIAGALNGGAQDVLVKAINICTECIGIG